MTEQITEDTKELATRPDYSQLRMVTIDGESTRDIDDAIHVSKTDDGFRVVVAISNPTKAVVIGSTEDLQAKLVAATAYIRDYPVQRMLPGSISENNCSLVAGKERRVLIFDILLSDDLEVASLKIARTRITVSQRISYGEIPGILENRDHPDFEMLTIASALARQLLASRRKHGAMAFYDLSLMIMTDEDGNIMELKDIKDTIGNVLVQEMMILTNQMVAKYMVEHNIPGLYRNHEAKAAAPASKKLLETLEGWMQSRTFDIEVAREQFNLLAGRARYAPTVIGHHGLNLPFYTHITSPLRRYADLINMRQLISHLKGLPYDYSNEVLEALANDLNEALERRRDERTKGYIRSVQKTAERAMDSGELSRLADHEMSQAIKMSVQSGYMTQMMIDELIRRMDDESFTDKLADRLILDVPKGELADGLAKRLAKWLADHPSKSMHLLMHAVNTRQISAVEITSNGSGVEFTATASALDKDGNRHEHHAKATRKRDAEQIAALHLIGSLSALTIPEMVFEPVAVGNNGAAKGNYKSDLLELCQKRKWPMPTFSSIGRGQSHLMKFDTTVEVLASTGKITGVARNGANKKESESFASRHALEQLGINIVKLHEHTAEEPSTPEAVKANISVDLNENPIGFLQEIAQKKKFKMPVYSEKRLVAEPPQFECKVKVDFGAKGFYVGTGSSIQSAKKQAALEASKAYMIHAVEMALGQKEPEEGERERLKLRI